MRFLDLCAGIGGFSLGLEWAGMTCAGQVEIDPFCNKVLERHWPHVPRWKDLKNERDYDEYPTVDLVCGGYPCQPFSHAGKRRGAMDDRHLWPYVFRVCQKLRPAWCLFENVAGHITLGLDEVLSDLESAGYTTGATIIPACAVDAPHRRDRIWIIANRTGQSIERYSVGELRESEGRTAQTWGKGLRQANRADAAKFIATTGEALADADGCGLQEGGKFRAGESDARRRCQDVSDSNRAGRQERHSAAVTGVAGLGSRSSDTGGRVWLPEPNVGRVADGVPRRVDRLRALGNAVVPELVYEIGRAIVAAHKSFY